MWHNICLIVLRFITFVLLRLKYGLVFPQKKEIDIDQFSELAIKAGEEVYIFSIPSAGLWIKEKQ